MMNLKDILAQLPSASLKDLTELAAAAEKELQFRRMKELVEYVPNTLDNSLRDRVLIECDSMNFGDCNRKAGSQWLSTTDQPYIYTDSNPVHKAVDIKRFPAICEAMGLFNERFQTNNDSCLVLKYTTSTTSTREHADNESNLDLSQPICNITIGKLL